MVLPVGIPLVAPLAPIALAEIAEAVGVVAAVAAFQSLEIQKSPPTAFAPYSKTLFNKIPVCKPDSPPPPVGPPSGPDLTLPLLVVTAQLYASHQDSDASPIVIVPRPLQIRAQQICDDRGWDSNDAASWEECLNLAQMPQVGDYLTFAGVGETDSKNQSERNPQIQALIAKYQGGYALKDDDPKKKLKQYLAGLSDESFGLVNDLYNKQTSDDRRQAVLQFAVGDTQFYYEEDGRLRILGFIQKYSYCFGSDRKGSKTGNFIQRLVTADNPGFLYEIETAMALSKIPGVHLLHISYDMASHDGRTTEVDIVFEIKTAQGSSRVHASVKKNTRGDNREDMRKQTVAATDNGAVLLGVYGWRGHYGNPPLFERFVDLENLKKMSADDLWHIVTDRI